MPSCSALFRVPLPTLVGLNIARVFEGFFILLAWSGRLGGPFPQSAGWGDVITGLLAVPVMGLASRQATLGDRAIWIWIAFGTLDLLAAIALGVTSANGSPLQLIHRRRRIGGSAGIAVGAHSERAGSILFDRTRHHLRAVAGTKRSPCCGSNSSRNLGVESRVTGSHSNDRISGKERIDPVRESLIDVVRYDEKILSDEVPDAALEDCSWQMFGTGRQSLYDCVLLGIRYLPRAR